jgi:hypothetical protein
MNERHLLGVSIGILALAAGVFAVNAFLFQPIETSADVGPIEQQTEQTELPTWGHRVSGPYTHKNLTIYLVHGDERMAGKTPLTLEEALATKKAIVHETGDVNKLSIENVSPTEEVYVQAGDIVKGGQQDRVLAVDLIVPARSGRIPLDAFCVEHGRWTQRGSESRTEFNSSSYGVASKELKLAAKHEKSQAKVWNNVDVAQKRLSAATNTSVNSAESESSLPLALDNTVVRRNADDYLKALSKIIDGKSDVIGFVFAINGEMNSGDLYGSSALFRKLWPKLLKSAAIEAVGESNGEKAPPVSADDLQTFVLDAESGPVSEERRVTARIKMNTRETRRSVFLETLDRDQNNAWIHRNYITR